MLLYPYCACHAKKEMFGRVYAIMLVFYGDLVLYTTPVLYSTCILWCILIFVCLFVIFFETILWLANLSKDGTTRLNYCLKSELSVVLHLQLCSTCYTAVWIKNCMKSTSAIKVATVQKASNTKGRHHMPTTKSILFTEQSTKEDTGKSMNALHLQ